MAFDVEEIAFDEAGGSAKPIRSGEQTGVNQRRSADDDDTAITKRQPPHCHSPHTSRITSTASGDKGLIARHPDTARPFMTRHYAINAAAWQQSFVAAVVGPIYETRVFEAIILATPVRPSKCRIS